VAITAAPSGAAFLFPGFILRGAHWIGHLTVLEKEHSRIRNGAFPAVYTTMIEYFSVYFREKTVYFASV
jgi:hypothetical protein